MREYVATISQNGQATIPVEVRRLLGVGPGESVAFRVVEGTVRLMRLEFTLEQTFGSVAPIERPEDFEARAQTAKAEKVERTMRQAAITDSSATIAGSTGPHAEP